MNRLGVCHMWDRNRNSFLLLQGLTSALMIHFSISTNIVNKNGNFRKVSVFPPNQMYQFSYCSQKLRSYNCMYFGGLHNG